MRQLDAVHTNDGAMLETLPVCDTNGVMLCDAQGVSLALHALYYGHRELAHTLASRCSHIDVFTAAALNDSARLHHHLRTAPALIHAWAGDGFHALGLACFFAAPETVRVCIDYGADVNLPSNNSFHVAPIHSAVAADRIDIVQLLITAGADVNMAQQDGFRALHTAAQHGNRDMCLLLLAHGAERHAQTSAGHTARDIASIQRHTHLTDIL